MKNRSLHFFFVPFISVIIVFLTNSGSYAFGSMTGICKRSLISFLNSNLKIRSSQCSDKGRWSSSNQFKVYGVKPDREFHADTLDPEIAFDGDSVTIQKLEAPTGRNLKHQVHDHYCDDVNYYLDATNSFIKVLERGENDGLATRQPGLHPHQSRFHQPIVYHPSYSFSSWPSQKQTFPMTKFYHLAKALNTKQLNSKLPRPLVHNTNDYYRPLEVHEIPRAWISQPSSVICPTFLDRFISAKLNHKEEMSIGFRQYTKMPELIERTFLEVGGTILAAQLAHRYGLATHCAGGTHHASPSCGAGYTIINDMAVTANFLLRPELNGGTITDVHKVLVIDCDVHQGDGTARFVEQGIMDETEFVTYSIHCENNYPTNKANSTYDVGLPDNTEDSEYLEVLMKSVTQALDEQHPDFVLYDAGIDVHKDDFLGRLDLTDEGIRQRDMWVFETCVQRGIPIVGVIGGGYDKDSLKLARRHSIVHEAASYVWRKYHLWK